MLDKGQNRNETFSSHHNFQMKKLSTLPAIPAVATAAPLSEAFISGAASPNSDCLTQLRKSIITELMKHHFLLSDWLHIKISRGAFQNYKSWFQPRASKPAPQGFWVQAWMSLLLKVAVVVLPHSHVEKTSAFAATASQSTDAAIQKHMETYVPFDQ